VTEGANISMPLMKYRVHANQISQVFASQQLETSKLIAREYLIAAGFHFNPSDWELILTMHELTYTHIGLDSFFVANEWISQNKKLHFFKDNILEEFAVKKCKNILINQHKLSVRNYMNIVQTDLFKLIKPSFFSKIVYFKKVIKVGFLHNN
jgi:hypothetical protein